MDRKTSERIAVLAARAIAGAVLAFSGTLKAAGPAEEFALVIQYYQIVSPEMALSLATFLPWIELLIGLCLLTGYFTRQASAAAGGLFLMFIIALGSALARGFQLPNCGCFGAGWHPSMSTTILMDTGLLLLCALAYVKKDSPLSLDHWCEKIS